jgi:hypothetical protein
VAAGSNQVGVPGAGNVISGNVLSGVWLQGGGANTLYANRIGVGATEGSRVPNLTDGVLITDSGANLIGADAPGMGNVIAGNQGRGLVIGGSASSNVVAGNYIGIDSNGDARGNGADGVFVGPYGGIDAFPNTVGGGNQVAFNTGAGVVVFGDDSTGIAITQNFIHDNGGLGIDLGSDGVTPNHGQGNTVVGPNHIQNYPVLDSVGLTGATEMTVSGSLDTIGNREYRIEIFASEACDPSGYGEGQRYLGQATVSTDGDGHADFSQPVDAFLAGSKFITATARNVTPTDLYEDDTSEFSQCIEAPKAPEPPKGIDLFEGWNLVEDWPAGEASSAGEVIAVLDGSIEPNTWDSIAWYTGKVWLQTFANAPLPSFNTLAELEQGEDYWVFVTADTTLYAEP